MGSRDNGVWTGTNSSEKLFWVGMAEAAFIRSGYGSAESGEEDHVIGMFLEDILHSFLELCHLDIMGGVGVGKCSLRASLKVFMI